MNNTRDFLISTGKESLEMQHALEDDFMPVLLVELADGTHQIMALIGGHPYDMMRAILPTLREMHPVSLGLTVDSYMMLAGDNRAEMLATRQRYGNSLQAMFEDRIPGVSECLSIHIVTATNVEVIQLPYTRHRTEGITWDDEYKLPDEAVYGGRLIEVMREVWA